MNCKEAKVWLLPGVIGDLEPDSREYRQLEVHLRSCRACAEEYESSKWVVEFIGNHKSEFAEALHCLDKRAASQRERLERDWKSFEAKLDRLEPDDRPPRLPTRVGAAGRTTRRTRGYWMWKVAAAACFVLGVSLVLTQTNHKRPRNPSLRPEAVTRARSIRVELLSATGNVIIAPGEQVRTAAGRIETLIVDRKHRIVMNSDTVLSIGQPVGLPPRLPTRVGAEGMDHAGCSVRLTAGEILVHVEHDGKTFAVDTAHGNAVVMGTSFDVRVTDDSMRLVVVEGNVLLKSEKTGVHVTAGQTSQVFGRSVPTQPVSCNCAELTAWAAGHEIETALAKIRSSGDACEPGDLWGTVVSGPIDLEKVDYEDWIEEKREWFRREFPWMFQLRDALGKEGTEVDYQELLVQSGDVWQFAYPPAPHGRVAVADSDSLMRVASLYGFGEEWLLKNVPTAKSRTDDSSIGENRFTGQAAFEEWTRCFEDGSESSKQLDGCTLLHAFHAATYLVCTRTLAYFSVKSGRHVFRTEDEAELLVLLQNEVSAANELADTVMRLLRESQSELCGEYNELVDKVVEDVRTIGHIEKRIWEHEQKQ